MAEHARVLALSILDTWDPAHGPAPDLRLVIIEPSQLDTDTLASLREAGWGLCHIEMPDYMKVKGKDILSAFPFFAIEHSCILLKFDLKFLPNLRERISIYVKAGTIPQYTLSYSKLFVWNMTMYERLLWLDSDCLVVNSLHKLLARANRSDERKMVASF